MSKDNDKYEKLSDKLEREAIERGEPVHHIKPKKLLSLKKS